MEDNYVLQRTLLDKFNFCKKFDERVLAAILKSFDIERKKVLKDHNKQKA